MGVTIVVAIAIATDRFGCRLYEQQDSCTTKQQYTSHHSSLPVHHHHHRRHRDRGGVGEVTR